MVLSLFLVLHFGGVYYAYGLVLVPVILVVMVDHVFELKIVFADLLVLSYLEITDIHGL